MECPVRSPPPAAASTVRYWGNARSDWLTVCERCTAEFVKFAYGGVNPAATACADRMLEFSRLIACVVPNFAIRPLTTDIGTWLMFIRPALRREPTAAL